MGSSLQICRTFRVIRNGRRSKWYEEFEEGSFVGLFLFFFYVFASDRARRKPPMTNSDIRQENAGRHTFFHPTKLKMNKDKPMLRCKDLLQRHFWTKIMLTVTFIVIGAGWGILKKLLNLCNRRQNEYCI